MVGQNSLFLVLIIAYTFGAIVKKYPGIKLVEENHTGMKPDKNQHSHLEAVVKPAKNQHQVLQPVPKQPHSGFPKNQLDRKINPNPKLKLEVKQKSYLISVESNCYVEDYGSYGYIYSLNYPYCYPNNSNCTWTFTHWYSGYQIGIYFYPLQLEDYGCIYDYIEVRDGGFFNSPLLGRYCGIQEPGYIYSSSSQLRVEFVTDSIVTYSGFWAYYYSFPYVEETRISPTQIPVRPESKLAQVSKNQPPECVPHPNSTTTTTTTMPTPTEPTTTTMPTPTESSTTWKPPSNTTTKPPRPSSLSPVAPGITINNNNNMLVNFFDLFKLKSFFQT